MYVDTVKREKGQISASASNMQVACKPHASLMQAPCWLVRGLAGDKDCPAEAKAEATGLAVGGWPCRDFCFRDRDKDRDIAALTVWSSMSR